MTAQERRDKLNLLGMLEEELRTNGHEMGSQDVRDLEYEIACLHKELEAHHE